MREKVRLIGFACLFTFAGLLLGCGTERTDFDKGYDLGSSDVAKRQYWAQVNLQKQQSLLQRSCESTRYRTVSIPVYGKTEDGSKIAEYYVKTRVIDD